MALSKLTKVQTLGIGSNIEVVGVITTGQFKSGTSNLHSSGVELTNLNVSGIATIGGNVTIGGTLTYQDVTNIDSVGLITARNGINVIGHSELDNVSTSGIATIGGNVTLGQTKFKLVDTGGYLHIQTNTGEDTAKFQKDGGSFLYFNNFLRLETKLNGIDVTGRVTASNGFYGDGSNLTGVTQVGGASSVTFNDSVAANFGTDNDLRIFHDGSESVIGNNTGTFQFLSPNEIRYRATTHHFLSYGNDETMAKFIDDGAVELYHDASLKFSTTGHGCVVEDDNPYIVIKDNDTASGNGIVGWIEAQNSSGNSMWKIGNTHNDQNTLWINQRANASTKFTGAISGDTWEIYGNSGHFTPCSDNTFDIGESGRRIRNIYTADLHCSNRGSSNDVDGTWGDYTIQEGESDLFLINNRSGKKYKFNLTEVN